MESACILVYQEYIIKDILQRQTASKILMMLNLPPDTPADVAAILTELFDGEELGGFWVSDDLTKIQARVFVDGGGLVVQTYERDAETGKYKLTSYVPLGRARL